LGTTDWKDPVWQLPAGFFYAEILQVRQNSRQYFVSGFDVQNALYLATGNSLWVYSNLLNYLSSIN